MPKPGDWNAVIEEASEGDFIGHAVVDEDGEIVACGIPSEDHARLIAAAPRLLAACEALLEWSARIKDVRGVYGPVDAVFAAIDAVARAKGGA